METKEPLLAPAEAAPVEAAAVQPVARMDKPAFIMVCVYLTLAIHRFLSALGKPTWADVFLLTIYASLIGMVTSKSQRWQFTYSVMGMGGVLCWAYLQFTGDKPLHSGL